MASTEEEEDHLKALLDFKEGDYVYILGTNRKGVVRFIGLRPLRKGYLLVLSWALLEGRNNGTVDGIRYFTCKPKHGLFVWLPRLFLKGK